MPRKPPPVPPKGTLPPQAGKGRPKGATNRAGRDVRAIAQEYLPAATRRLAVLAGIVPKYKLRSGEAPATLETVQVMAIKELFDRGIGKATLPLQHSVDGQAFEALLLRLGRTPVGSLMPSPLMIDSINAIDVTEDDGVDGLIARLDG